MNYEGPYNWFQHIDYLHQVYLCFTVKSAGILLFLATWEHILSIIWHETMDAHWSWSKWVHVTACLFACSPCLCVHLNAPYFPTHVGDVQERAWSIEYLYKAMFLFVICLCIGHMNQLKNKMWSAHKCLIRITPPHSKNTFSCAR